MSLFDSFRQTSAELFAAFGTAATITTTTPGVRDRVLDTFGPATVTTRSVLAAMGKRRVRADDGTTTVETTAKINGPAKAGDRLTIGTSTYVIGDVEETAPDGGAPMLWTVTLS